MANRKVYEHKNDFIYFKGKFGKKQITELDMVEFSYKGANIYDPKPRVFVLSVEKKHLTGINMNYLDGYKVRKLMQEGSHRYHQHAMHKTIDNWKMRWYELYEDHIRSYSYEKIDGRAIRKFEHKQFVAQGR